MWNAILRAPFFSRGPNSASCVPRRRASMCIASASTGPQRAAAGLALRPARLPVSTTMTIKAASNAEAATTFIDVGSHGSRAFSTNQVGTRGRASGRGAISDRTNLVHFSRILTRSSAFALRIIPRGAIDSLEQRERRPMGFLDPSFVLYAVFSIGILGVFGAVLAVRFL
jgi:hypothetical protein